MRIFYVPKGSILEIHDLNLSGGVADGGYGPDYGGQVIYADGGVDVWNSAFVNNLAYGPGASGGAVFTSKTGSLMAVETTFADNEALAPGGYAYGGAIFNLNSLSLSNSTVAGNSVSGAGSPIYQFGAGIFDEGASVTPTGLYNTIIAGNSGAADFDDDSTCGAFISFILLGSSVNLIGNVETLDQEVQLDLHHLQPDARPAGQPWRRGADLLAPARQPGPRDGLGVQLE